MSNQYDLPEDYFATAQAQSMAQNRSFSLASTATTTPGEIAVSNGTSFEAGTLFSGSGITASPTYSPSLGIQLGVTASTLKSTLGIMSGIWKLGATAAPTVNDDSSLGYSQGSLWFDGTTPSIYGCTSAALGAAVWLKLSP